MHACGRRSGNDSHHGGLRIVVRWRCGKQSDRTDCGGQQCDIGRGALRHRRILERSNVQRFTSIDEPLPRALRRHAVLHLARAIGRELGEPILLWRSQLQLYTMDDAHLQRRAKSCRHAQDVEHDRLHAGFSAHPLRASTGFQRVSVINGVETSGTRSAQTWPSECPECRRRRSPGTATYR